MQVVRSYQVAMLWAFLVALRNHQEACVGKGPPIEVVPAPSILQKGLQASSQDLQQMCTSKCNVPGSFMGNLAFILLLPYMLCADP